MLRFGVFDALDQRHRTRRQRRSKHLKHHNWKEVNVLLVLALRLLSYSDYRE